MLSFSNQQNPTLRLTEEDLSFIRQVLPLNLHFNPAYYRTDSKYVTFLTAFAFPSYLSDLTFAGLFKMDDVVVTLDVTPLAKSEVRKDLASSLDELQSRHIIERSNAEAMNNAYEFHDLQGLLADVERGNEQVVSTTLRFMITATSYDSLCQKVKKVKDRLDFYGIETKILQNELHSEYRSLQMPSDVSMQPLPLYGTFARQYMFYYQNHVDPRGLYFGYTITGGQVVLDTFRETNTRKSFDIILVGVKGSGKSAALKAMAQDVVSLGHKVITMDVDGEMRGLAEKLGGKVITLGNRSGERINALELKQQALETDTDAGDVSNFAAEIARIESFLYQYAPEITNLEAEELKDILLETYKSKGIDENTDITLLQPQDYPIFSDVLLHLRKRLYSRYDSADSFTFHPYLTERKRALLENLEVYIKAFAEGIYAPMFNGHSTLSLSDEDFVVFDVKNLTQMGDRICNAQLFNIMSWMWNEVCKNRARNRFTFDERDRRYVACLIDEAHRFISAKNPQGVDFIEKLVRRSRKYDAGLWFASQNTTDFMPQNAGALEEKIKTIFALVQYKMILCHDSSALPTLGKLFPEFTDGELAATNTFGKGEMLLSLGGKQKLHCFRFIPKEYFAYFHGGRENEGGACDESAPACHA